MIYKEMHIGQLNALAENDIRHDVVCHTESGEMYTWFLVRVYGARCETCVGKGEVPRPGGARSEMTYCSKCNRAGFIPPLPSFAQTLDAGVKSIVKDTKLLEIIELFLAHEPYTKWGDCVYCDYREDHAGDCPYALAEEALAEMKQDAREV